MAERIKDEDVARLMNRVSVDATSGCWMWTGGTRGQGYSCYYLNGRAVNGHRASWEMFIGLIPPGIQVLHKCDVRLCVNPAHLFLGTNDDNVRDKIAKGRAAYGSKHGQTKLTENDIRAIRVAHNAGITQLALSKKHGVHRATIWRIVHRKQWEHVA